MPNVFRAQRALISCLSVLAALSSQALALVQDDETRERNQLRKEVHAYWHRGDIERLDALAGSLRSSDARSRSSYPLLAIYYDSIIESRSYQGTADFPGGDDWVRVELWMATHSNSPTPTIVKALMLLDQAGKGPSRGSLASLTPSAANPDYLAAARSVLASHVQFASQDPHWHMAMIELRLLDNEPVSDVLIAHAQALDQFPDYLPLHAATARRLTSRWYPDMRRIEAFINTVSKRAPSGESDATYARLVEQVNPMLHARSPFNLDGIDEARLRNGFERIRGRYPTAWNANTSAYFACLTSNRAWLTSVWPEAEKSVVREVWQSPTMFDHCKSFVIH